MTESELKTFVDVVVHYFEDVTDIPAEMGIPYVRTGESVLLDHTGVIGVSGKRRGGIYVTATEDMLRDLVALILGAEDIETEDVLDMVGELSNTIAGNVRRAFGSSFLISVPIVLRGRPDDILMKLKPPVFVIPIRWNSHRLFLSVGLE